MRCIFCKCVSNGCASVEHIVPESLANREHTLPRGWVCDSCNNYLGRKVEKPFLDSLYGATSRFWMGVPNKKGRIPSVKGLHRESQTPIQIFPSLEDGLSFTVCPADGQDATKWVSSILSERRGTSICSPRPSPRPT